MKEWERIDMWGGEERRVGNEGCWDVSTERTQWLGDLAISDLQPPQMPGCHPEPQTNWPSHPSGIHRNKSRRDCHLFLREKDWTGNAQGNWVQWARILGHPVSIKVLGFWEVEGWTPCLLSIVQLFALGQPSPGSWRPWLSGPQVQMEGASASPSSSQWVKLLRLDGPASLPGFPGREEGGASPFLLPALFLSLVGMPRWNSLNFVNKNPTRKRTLGTEQEQTTLQLGRHNDLSISLVLRIILLDRYYYFIPFRNEV